MKINDLVTSIKMLIVLVSLLVLTCHSSFAATLRVHRLSGSWNIIASDDEVELTLQKLDTGSNYDTAAYYAGEFSAVEYHDGVAWQGPIAVNNVVKVLKGTSTTVAGIVRLEVFGYAGINGVNGRVYGLKVIPEGPNGLIYVGGFFTEAGGYPGGRGFAVYYQDGSGWSRYSDGYPSNITGWSGAYVDQLTIDNGKVVARGVDVTGFTDYVGWQPASSSMKAKWHPDASFGVWQILQP